MSLILDALKRAEHERNATPLLVTADLPSATRTVARPLRYWRPAGVLLLLIVSGLLAWSFLRGNPGAEDKPAVITNPAPVISASPAPGLPTPYVIPGTEAVVSLDDLTKSPLGEEAVILPEPVERQPATPAPASSVNSPTSHETPDEKSLPATPAAERMTDSAAEPAPPTPPPSVLTQSVPLRKFREMPPEYRADFPAITVEIHVYESTVAQRFVMINGRRYRQGERMAEGPAVIEIVRDGIVLEFRGEKVLYTLAR